LLAEKEKALSAQQIAANRNLAELEQRLQEEA